MKTLQDALILRSSENEKGIVFVHSSQERFISFQSIFQQAMRTLGALQNAGVEPGNEVVFQIEDNESFICVFWACIYGGMIPVPVSMASLPEYKRKLFRIWAQLKNPYLVTDLKHVDSLKKFVDSEMIFSREWSSMNCRVLLTDSLLKENNWIPQVHVARPSDIAFVQFSSGSTGDPKGVMISHENVMYNISAIIKATKYNENDIAVSWMPLTHDLGLVGFHLTFIIANMDLYLLTSSLFMLKPALWMQVVSTHRATVTCSPNFGYNYFCQHFDCEKAGDLDLSTLRLIINGAEPISPDVVRNFTNLLEPYGLKRSSIFNVYGMAEASLGVTTPPLAEDMIVVSVKRQGIGMGKSVFETENSDDCAVFVDLGYPIDYVNVRICDENNQMLPDMVYGEIQIYGKNVTIGYLNQEEKNRNAFSSDGWLRTGDMGFMRGGRLVVTGRIKDVLFVNGQNFYAHDVERVVESVEGMERGVAAVVGWTDSESGNEVIALFIQTRNHKSMIQNTSLFNRIQSQVNQMFGFRFSDIIPIRRLPKTTSGKVQRYVLSEQYRNGFFHSISRGVITQQTVLNVEDINEIEILPSEEEKISRIWGNVLKVRKVSRYDNFFEMGGNSLKVAELIAQIQTEFKVAVPFRQIFDHPHFHELVSFLQTATPRDNRFIPKVSSPADSFELSSAQHSMYVLYCMDPKNTIYNLNRVFEVDGELKLDRLQTALNNLVNRHEILRTSFVVENDVPRQKILDKVNTVLEFSESSDTSDVGVEKWLERFIRPFDLGEAPLFRVGIMKIGERRHILAFDIHHIVIDASSASIFLHDLEALYAGTQMVAKPSLEYKDYALWQRNRFNDEVYVKQEAYWLKELSGELPVLQLPLDHKRPAVQRFIGDYVDIIFDSSLKMKIDKLAKDSSSTLYMVLLAAYQTLLYRYTGQEDIIVGSPIVCRPHSDLKGIMGMFANTLLMRGFPKGDKSFAIFLQEMKETAIRAYENQEVPFETLVSKIGGSRDSGRNPLFDVMLVVHDLNFDELKLADVQVTRYNKRLFNSKFDLTIEVAEYKSDLRCRFEYNSELFKRESIERWTAHWLQLLEQVVEEPEVCLGEINLLPESEKRQVLVEFNDTGKEYEKDKTIHELFEEQVERTPEAVAVVYEGEELTYRELNAKANQLARYLRRLGVRENDLIGIGAERSLELIVGLLGILKAGGAYVPFDMTYPDERLAYMFADTGVKFVVTVGDTARKCTQFVSSVVNLDNDAVLIAMENIENLSASSIPRLAYINYTSGSTGIPKGVCIPHLAVLRLVQNDFARFDENEIFLHYSNLSFDAATFEVWGALLCGAKLIVMKAAVTSVELLMETITLNGVTTLWVTSQLFNIMAEQGIDGFGVVHQLIVGGDVVSPLYVQKVYERYSEIELINGYGPTENTTFSCYFSIPRNWGIKELPIGRPVKNTKVYVLDPWDQLVPIGVPGELCVSGAGLARGYLNQPELTAEKFVENPFEPGERMYRTGDLARWLPDGNLEYLGRIDQQVKIRGFRIELGEI
ncbi:amino acid adenylation domain-containing protein, partial [Alicyclobacillus fodiniaquatilis]